MAQRKTDFIVEVQPSGSIRVWSDLTQDQIGAIEGVIETQSSNPALIIVQVDPRYDSDEIADEIKELVALSK